MSSFKRKNLPPSDGEWVFYHSIHRWGSMLNGQFHNSLGPAIIHFNADGTIHMQAWLVDGKYHRDDGPAIIYADGTKIWRVNGMFHRLDGPTWERADGTKHWFINGIEYHSAEFPKAVIMYLLSLKGSTAQELVKAIEAYDEKA